MTIHLVSLFLALALNLRAEDPRRIDEPTIPSLKEKLETKDPKHCIRICGVLEKMGKKARPAVPDLIRFLSAGDPKVRIAALKALEAAEDESAIAPIIELLKKEKNIYVAYEAVRTFRTFSKFKCALAAVPVLIRLNKNPPEIKEYKDYIEERKDREQYGWKMDLTGLTVNGHFSDLVPRVIISFRERAIPLFLPILPDHKNGFKDRALAIQVLRGIVLKLRGSEKKESFNRAVQEIVPAISQALDDPDVRIRRFACNSLRSFEQYGKQGLPKLKEVVNRSGEDELVKKVAKIAIKEIEGSGN